MHKRLKPSGFLWFSVLLVSCGLKSPPEVIYCVTTSVPGHIHLRPCVPGLSASVNLDSNGNGSTSACPSSDNVEIAINRNGSITYILPEQVHVDRAGDGIAVSIDAEFQ
jgi:hypothetical protein